MAGLSSPWVAALANAGLGMLEAGGQGRSTGEALAAGGRGALAGLDQVRQAGMADREHMMGLAQLQSQMESAGAQRAKWAADAEARQAELAAAARQQEAIAQYAGQLPEADRALLMADPESYLSQAAQSKHRDPYMTVGNSVLRRGDGGLDVAYTAPAEPMSPYQQQMIAIDRERLGLDREKLNQGPEPTSLMQELISAGYQPGTPEFRDVLTRIKTKPQTEINMGDKAATAGAVTEAQLGAKARVERSMAIGDELATAEAGIRNVEEMGKLATKAPSGPMAKPLSVMDKAIETVTGGYGGIGVDAAAGDELNSRLSKEILNAATYLTGTISDSDMAIITEASGGGWTSEEGRKRVFQIMKDGYERKAKMLRAEQEALDQGMSAIEAKQAASRASSAGNSNRIKYDANGNRIP